METKFFDGQEVATLSWPSGNFSIVGVGGIEKIVVGMENGQMAGVVWFNVYRDGKITDKHNGALVESVVMKCEGE